MSRRYYKKKESTTKMVDEYYEFLVKYQKMYGEKVIVLYQNGKFYEIYSVENDEEKWGDVINIAENILHMQWSHKASKEDKFSDKINRVRPYMCGFPVDSLDRHLDAFMKNGYSVVLVDQITDPPNPKRGVTKVISPSTYMDSTDSTNNMMVIYLEFYKGKFYIGMSLIDVSTGICSVYEVYSKNGEKCSNDSLQEGSVATDELYRFIHSNYPKEIVFYCKNMSVKEDDIIRTLDLEGMGVLVFDVESKDFDKKVFNVEYQNQFFGKVYPEHKMLSPIEYIELSMYNYALISFLLLLQFAYEHDNTILNRLSIPFFWKMDDHLILTYNCSKQLHLLSQNKQKNSSVFNIICNTSTPLGKRRLMEKFMNPIKDIKKLEKSYSAIDAVIKNNYKIFEAYLNPIIDIERMHRRIELLMIGPSQFFRMVESYRSIISLNEAIKNVRKDLEHLVLDDSIIEKVEEFIEKFINVFNVQKMSKFSMNNISCSFFNDGISPKIDKYNSKYTGYIQKLRDIASELSNHIDNNNDYVKIDNTDKEGYYLITTAARCKKIKEALKDSKNYKFKELTNDVKITSKEIDNISKDITTILPKLIKTVKKEYKNQIKEFRSILIPELINFVAEMDVLKSHAKTAVLYSYNRPEVLESDNSFIETTGIRHPIIERINMNEEYIPNDVTLNKSGILLYGINYGGKSSLMRSIGINLILAQMGGFVAAKTFKYYPYDSIISRITGDDNLFKNQSMFTVEMTELRTILKRSTTNTLVLGDEICHGTEHHSGLAIVAASIKKLSKIGASFIFATHMHDLSEVEEINNLPNISKKHLYVEIDENKFAYHRILRDGPGPDTYGIEVARSLDMGSDFIKDALSIRNRLMSKNEKILETKTSKYNPNVFVHHCMICGSNSKLETHHIKEQCTAVNNRIDHHHKNNKHNLAILCKKCHDRVTYENLVVTGYIQTTDGIQLQFSEK